MKKNYSNTGRVQPILHFLCFLFGDSSSSRFFPLSFSLSRSLNLSLILFVPTVSSHGWEKCFERGSGLSKFNVQIIKTCACVAFPPSYVFCLKLSGLHACWNKQFKSDSKEQCVKPLYNTGLLRNLSSSTSWLVYRPLTTILLIKEGSDILTSILYNIQVCQTADVKTEITHWGSHIGGCPFCFQSYKNI